MKSIVYKTAIAGLYIKVSKHLFRLPQFLHYPRWWPKNSSLEQTRDTKHHSTKTQQIHTNKSVGCPANSLSVMYYTMSCHFEMPSRTLGKLAYVQWSCETYFWRWPHALLNLSCKMGLCVSFLWWKKKRKQISERKKTQNRLCKSERQCLSLMPVLSSASNSYWEW